MAPAEKPELAWSLARPAAVAASSPTSRDFSPSPAPAPRARWQAKSSKSAAPSAADKDASKRKEQLSCAFHAAWIARLGRARRKCLADPHGGGKGDLYYHVRVLTPTKLTREQRKLIEQLGASLKVENKPAERGSSLFDKVKDIFG